MPTYLVTTAFRLVETVDQMVGYGHGKTTRTYGPFSSNTNARTRMEELIQVFLTKNPEWKRSGDQRLFRENEDDFSGHNRERIASDEIAYRVEEYEVSRTPA